MGHYTASMKRVKGIAERMEGRMGWTREKPKEPGAYWLRREGEIEMIVIFRNGCDELEVNCQGDYELENYDGEWQGPITPEP